MNDTLEMPDPHQDSYSKTLFGFWLYLISDFIMFSALFATYAVLQTTEGVFSLHKQLMGLSYSFFQATILFLASFFSGVAGVFVHKRRRKGAFIGWGITFFLGLLFFSLQLFEFSHLIQGGNSWEKNAFLSIYFTIVATHGVHVFFALLWVLVFLAPLIKNPIHLTDVRRLTCLKLFWQFLNVIWIFIFTLVYLMR